MHKTPFLELSSLDIINRITKQLKNLGEPVYHVGDIHNEKVFLKACYAVMDEIEDFPLTERDMFRLWRLHGKIKRVRRPMNGVDFVITPFNTLDMPVTKEYLDEIETIRQCLYGMLLSLHQMRMFIYSLDLCSNANHDAVHALRKDVNEYFAYLKSTAPYGICPYCKGIDWYQQQCEMCYKTGWVNYDTFYGSPEKIRLEKVVWFDNKAIDIPLALERRQRELSKTHPA